MASKRTVLSSPSSTIYYTGRDGRLHEIEGGATRLEMSMDEQSWRYGNVFVGVDLGLRESRSAEMSFVLPHEMLFFFRVLVDNDGCDEGILNRESESWS